MSESTLKPRPSARAANPALKFLVLYLRPAPRGGLLDVLVNLGVFVVEEQAEAEAARIADIVCADIAIVFADCPPNGLQALDELVARGVPVIVALPLESPTGPYMAAGARLCTTDDLCTPTGAILLAPIAAEARAKRRSAAAPPDRRVFGRLTFDRDLPALVLGTHSRPLSRSERAVLERLSQSGGRPVDVIELERCARPDGMLTHPGFLKAVVLRLRRKAEELGGNPEALRSVRGVGYSLAP